MLYQCYISAISTLYVSSIFLVSLNFISGFYVCLDSDLAEQAFAGLDRVGCCLGFVVFDTFFSCKSWGYSYKIPEVMVWKIVFSSSRYIL